MRSLYNHELGLKDLTDMSDEALMERATEIAILYKGTEIKYHQEQAERFLQHVEFELRWRNGEFTQ